MSALDDLLNNEPGAWERGAFGADELVARCCTWLAQLPQLEGVNRRATRALWLVDRLCGKTCPDAITELDQPALSATVYYIRARRDPALILRTDPKCPDVSLACDAWVSAYSPGVELLRWYDLDDDTVSSGNFLGGHVRLPVEEYGRMGADAAALIPLVASPVHAVSITASRFLLRRLASDLKDKPSVNDELISFLRDAGANELASVIEANVHADQFRDLSLDLFLARAEGEDMAAVAELVAHPWSSRFALERLVKLVQADCPELWQAALHVGSFTNDVMRIFCQWVSPEQCDLLLPHMGHADEEVAAVAFHAYMYRAPAGAVQDIVDASPHEWMRCAWDRYRFAPALVRPSEVVACAQDVDCDRRLMDPFNWRAY